MICLVLNTTEILQLISDIYQLDIFSENIKFQHQKYVHKDKDTDVYLLGYKGLPKLLNAK